MLDASIEGDRNTLKWDSFIPAAMAAIYLLLFLYFKTIGGYKPVHFAEELTGGTTGPDGSLVLVDLRHGRLQASGDPLPSRRCDERVVNRARLMQT